MKESIRYISSGLFESVGSWQHPARTIDTNELICVLRGEVCMRIAETDVRLHRGDLLHIAAHTRHAGFAPSEHVSFLWMHYTGDTPAVTQYSSGDRGETAGFLRAEQLFRQLLHMANAYGYPDGATDLAAQLLLIEAARQMQSDRDETALTGRINEWIRLNAHRRIRVTDVAAAFGYNADYLTRAYRKSDGRSIKQAVDEARMDLIRSRLLSGQNTLGELWEQTGFEDYKSFLKFFTYHTGMTPSAYRNLYPGMHINHK